MKLYKGKIQNPKIRGKNTKFGRKIILKIPNLEFLINFDSFIMTQNFYNIFFSKIDALPIILIPSFGKSIENSDHNDFFNFFILDKFSVSTIHMPNDVQPSTGRSPECMSLNGIEI